MMGVTVREMTKEETPLLAKWLYAHRDVNRVDLEPFRRNQVKIYVMEDETGIICFIPSSTVILLGALAPRPGVESDRLKSAFYAMDEFLAAKAREDNIQMTLVQPNDTNFAAFLKNKLKFDSFVPEILYLNYNQESVKCQKE
jgi:hypothetical protein